MRPTTLTKDEIAARGQSIFENQIRKTLEASHAGHFLVIDIESGDFEIAPKDVDATARLRSRRPNAITFGVRIGSPASYRLGGRFRLR